MRVAATILMSTVMFVTGCAGNKALRDIDYNAEFQEGKTALAKKKYSKAQMKFNTVVIGASHTDLGDDAIFYLGESHYLGKEYLLAIAEYDRLIRKMPFSDYVEKARYRICQSYVTLSPKYFRDQTYSEKAIGKLQEFIDDYPNSKHGKKAQDDIKDLRNKLSEKSYESGVLYMKMEEYKAALLAFEQVTELYYDTEYIDQTHLKIIECYFRRGELEISRNHFDSKRKHIENLGMAEVVEKWFELGRVMRKIEVE
ncbi:MAG: outer membrane protein assembly factor BamD [Candidatus Marinimicrobia bacterium]|jgi:outer membrane protein assembly factor BamD|nr:outer membrane protein assembly factor BamD [Candidatus Neomarinimicrobiota bacterium]MBT3763458.1 outer membrane protein assembly factor BamD [Candidatus Neomarinimicrobiota bacterium]MBT4371802.1 outer membrane protein assembly factor BamD [Candidatus Neomarinimicrobiota bacterium]MBT5175481.1 outer membrane protein assembly factor BamD [Candidatus Neomarinimicrobiota bacterium]MBT6417068.1 outer membrane protein assembly factor BamD [Candidatus Neomarinimicrobiota bacterium]